MLRLPPLALCWWCSRMRGLFIWRQYAQWLGSWALESIWQLYSNPSSVAHWLHDLNVTLTSLCLNNMHRQKEHKLTGTQLSTVCAGNRNTLMELKNKTWALRSGQWGHQVNKSTSCRGLGCHKKPLGLNLTVLQDHPISNLVGEAGRKWDVSNFSDPHCRWSL